MQCFPSVETTKFHEGLLSNIAVSFNRGRKSNERATNLHVRLVAGPETKPKTPPGAVSCVAAVTKSGFSSDSYRETIRLQMHLFLRGPAGGNGGSLGPVLPSFVLH